MPLGTEVDLGRGHIVLDGDPAVPPPRAKGAQQVPLFFGPCLLAMVTHLGYCQALVITCQHGTGMQNTIAIH